jgi:hypothetical protein
MYFYEFIDSNSYQWSLLLLILPISDLLQQFEDYVKGIVLRKRKGKISNNKKISLKICTKQGVSLKIRWGNGRPEGLDWVTRHCSLR